VEAIASHILNRAQSGLPLEEPFEAGKKYFALTADDIRIAFAKLIRTEDLVQVVRGPLWLRFATLHSAAETSRSPCPWNISKASVKKVVCLTYLASVKNL
jgi:hypothetical protein